MAGTIMEKPMDNPDSVTGGGVSPVPMTIEQQALALLNEVSGFSYPALNIAGRFDLAAALRIALERHEADKQAMSEVASSALAFYQRAGEGDCLTAQALSRFIIAPPVDPITEALQDHFTIKEMEVIRAALAKHGLAITGVE